MERNTMLALHWMMRQRHGFTLPLPARSEGVGFRVDGIEIIEFEVSEPEAVERQVNTNAGSEIAMYRMAVKAIHAMARRQVANNERLAVARATILRKTLDDDDETHLGFAGLGVLERRRPIEEVQLAGDEVRLSAAKGDFKNDSQTSMWRKFVRKSSSTQARFGSMYRSVKRACTPSSSSGESECWQLTGRRQGDTQASARFLRWPSRNQSRVIPSFDAVEPHPDATSSNTPCPRALHPP
eukprot:TRINITY_DN57372_c0_g1_i1.p1 TRINITY_DN57372_c0_g1~~TRINITY_DN57372_c0_g1_i1.p1  ORF type:complete len:240 (-),score=24.17 TRINITY_DN57372_c0_g1_i1:71-790(-)